MSHPGLARSLAPLALFVAFQALLVLVSAWDVGKTADVLRSEQAMLRRDLDASPLAATVQFFLLYVAASTLLLPGASLWSLSAGAVFGPVAGAAIASGASTIGAWVAFAVTRGLLAPWMLRRAPPALLAAIAQVERRGALWLLAARLTPLAPFSLVNVAFGLTSMSTTRFVLLSWIGMLPGTIAYVRLGNELSRVDTGRDFVTPLQLLPGAVLATLMLVGLALAAYALLTRRRYAAPQPEAR